MSLTYGFYNSLNHDRMYDAVEVSQLFDGLINDGVYQSIGGNLMVDTVGSNYQITVDSGRAWFHHTWSYNDAKVVIKMPDPPTYGSRLDIVVLDINGAIEVRENSFLVVSGNTSTSGTPTKPTLINDDENLHWQVPLAEVYRRKRETEQGNILQSDITNCVGVTQECPWVNGLIEKYDIAHLLSQWAAAWNEFKDRYETAAEAWMNEQQNIFNLWATNKRNEYENWTSTQEDDFLTWSNKEKNIFAAWMTGRQVDFNEWFANLQYVLDGDVAGHLQNEIDDITRNLLNPLPIERGGTGNKDGYIRTGHKDDSMTSGTGSTEEGFGTLATGIAAHAEGGGDITVTQDPGGLYFKESADSEYQKQEVSFSMTGGVIQSKEYTTSGAVVGGYAIWMSCWLGILVTKNNKYLFSNIFAIGSGAINSPYYSGILTSEQTGAYDDECVLTNNIIFENSVLKIFTDSTTMQMHADKGSNPSYGRTNPINILLKDLDSSNHYDFYISTVNLTRYKGNPIIYIDLPYEVVTSEGYTLASGKQSHAEGYKTAATGDYSHAEGIGDNSECTLKNTFHQAGWDPEDYDSEDFYYPFNASTNYSADFIKVILTVSNDTVTRNLSLDPTSPYYMSENSIELWRSSVNTRYYVIAYKNSSYIEIRYKGPSNSSYVIDVECYANEISSNYGAFGTASHSEGYHSIASGNYSHAEGYSSAIGNYSHAEGSSQAKGNYSHSENSGYATGVNSHAGGRGRALYDDQFVHGNFSLGGRINIIISDSDVREIPNTDPGYLNGFSFGMYAINSLPTIKIPLFAYVDDDGETIDTARGLWLLYVLSYGTEDSQVTTLPCSIYSIAMVNWSTNIARFNLLNGPNVLSLTRGGRLNGNGDLIITPKNTNTRLFCNLVRMI